MKEILNYFHFPTQQESYHIILIVILSQNYLKMEPLHIVMLEGWYSFYLDLIDIFIYLSSYIPLFNCRWTRKIDLFSKHKVFFPINISNTHWTLAVSYMDEKKIVYYDSLGGVGDR